MSWIQFVANLATGVIDRIWQRQNDQHNLDDQADKARELTRFNRLEQEKLFENTSYPKQVELMKKAGLSVGKIYASGGSGGSTALAASGGVNAEKDKQNTVSAALMQSNSLEQQQANIELTKAQTENVEADTRKKEGVDTEVGQATAKNLLQDVENKKALELLTKAQTYITDIDGYIKGNTAEYSIGQIRYDSERAYELVRQAKVAGNVAEATEAEQIEIIKKNALQAGLINVLTSEQIGKTKQEAAKIAQEIAYKPTEMQQNRDRISNEFNRNSIENRKTEIQKALGEQGLDLAQQKIALDAIETLLDIGSYSTKKN